jgi:hypothetical protein
MALAALGGTQARAVLPKPVEEDPELISRRGAEPHSRRASRRSWTHRKSGWSGPAGTPAFGPR